MNSSMLSFLQSLGATISDDDSCRFATESDALVSLDRHNVLVPLSQYGLLEVRGPEAEKFLQGQITCSAAAVTPTLSSPGAYCTPKGRVVASFQLLRPQNEVFWLRMRGDVLDIAARTLGKYVVFSKAKLTSLEAIVGIGLNGAAMNSALLDLIGTLPTQRHGTLNYADGLLLQCDEAGTRFEYWGPVEAATKLWEHCAPHAIQAGSNYWRRLQIRAGNAEICAATSETFLPHMLNYHESGAINFNKGCYTGQEIVARTHYRGQVKRHLLCAALDAPAPLPGSDVTSGDGRVVGTVVDSVTVDQNAAEILAVVADDSVEASAILRVGSHDLRAAPLPYAIP